MKFTKSVPLAVIAVATIALASGGTPVDAQTLNATVSTSGPGQHQNRMGMPMGKNMPGKPAVIGKVTAVSGTTLTVTNEGFKRGPETNASTPAVTSVTYSVNAASATVYKNNATTTLSSIAVGDMVMIEGTVTGTTVVATKINAGMMFKGAPTDRKDGDAPKNVLMQGNGQPVVAGTISAINGTTITLTNKSNVTYTVDVSTAKIEKNGTVGTPATLVTGDSIIVQGAVTGTNITASSVIDTGTKQAQSKTMGNTQARGFFGNIGHFFANLFGF